jgi:hypothetical protein
MFKVHASSICIIDNVLHDSLEVVHQALLLTILILFHLLGEGIGLLCYSFAKPSFRIILSLKG